MVELKKITWENFNECLSLDVTENQQNFIDSNVYALAQAYVAATNDKFPPIAYAVYNDQTVVGIVILVHKYAKDNKIKTYMPIDWDATLKLWYEDAESYKNKTLVKKEEKEYFRIKYDKTRADYNNKSFYKLEPNRELKLRLKEKIRNKEIDAFLK